MRRYFVLVLTLLIVSQPAAAQTRSVFWQRWDVTITDVNVRDNRFQVTEDYDVHFTGSFSFGSRVVALTNLDSVDNVSVSQDGRPFTASCSENPGTYCVRMTQDGLSIRYYFLQPIANSSGNFQISYRVNGALRVYEGGDQLWWTAIPEEHFGFSIGSSTITVELPPGFGPREGIDRADTYGAPGSVTVSGTTVRATATRTITGNEKFELRVQFPHDSAARKPAWQESFDARRAYDETVGPLVNLGLLGMSLLIAVGGPLAVLAFWYQRGRDPKIGPVPAYLTEPPSDLPPAVVGALVDESVETRDIMSTLIDLGQRGYLVMEEDQRPGVFGIGVKREFVFKRTDKALNQGLRTYEKRMMNRIFSGGRKERTLESLRNSFYTAIPQIKNELYKEMVTENLFKTDPDTIRKFWYGVGVVGLVGTVVLFSLIAGVSDDIPTGAFLCLPLALGLTSVFTLLMGTFMPAKTRLGAEEAAKWKAFREYLQNLEKYNDVESASSRFADYLPYAVAFGLDRSWVRKFARVDRVPIPYWYYPTYVGGPYRGGYVAGTPLPQADYSDLARAGGDFNVNTMADSIAGSLQSMSDGLTEMINSASQVFTSKPQSSSSGSWSGGGGGWSGGGSSGGGSSGGGSSGFG